MTDLNKLREEFEQLQNIKYHIDMHHVFYCGKDGYKTNIAELDYVACYVKGAWYAYQKQQAKFDLYMNDFTIAANCVKSQQKTIDALKAQLDKLESGDYVLVPKGMIDSIEKSCNNALDINNLEIFKGLAMAILDEMEIIAAAQEQNND